MKKLLAITLGRRHRRRHICNRLRQAPKEVRPEDAITQPLTAAAPDCGSPNFSSTDPWILAEKSTQLITFILRPARLTGRNRTGRFLLRAKDLAPGTGRSFVFTCRMTLGPTPEGAWRPSARLPGEILPVHTLHNPKKPLPTWCRPGPI